MLRTVFQHVQRRTFSNTSRLFIAEGDKIPNIEVQLKSPAETVKTADFFQGKKAILFGVPGAFTPGCSKSHLPGYIHQAKELKKKGIDTIACVAINDAFVMNEWGKAHQAEENGVTLLADFKGEFAKAMELDFDATGALGNHRFKRFAAILDNGKVQKLFVEPDNTGLKVSLVENVAKHL
ncbi:Redoxin [Gilbertella persicaria]|uniref:Redoxin n=1 Tax=Gilbertella persicaria TaxID=101096 RepID=UPI00221F53AB|nr:Redoxin [Gilbertella persicaria]KAI8061846.1 Redoxin [Gilbertella persicaria]